MSYKSNRFVFVIPSYNNEDWVERNLSSITTQTYQNWKIIYCDDMSEDLTLMKVYDFIKQNIYDENNKITVIENKKRMYMAYNRQIMINMCDDEDIICCLDGDDWLYDKNVLQKLNDFYNKNDVNITWGSYIEYENNKLGKVQILSNFPSNIAMSKNYRKYKWISSHMKTFRARLGKQIPFEYYKLNGEYIKISSDLALMFYILEICEAKHKCVDFITYVYNIENSKRHHLSHFNYRTHKRYRDNINAYLRNYKNPKIFF